jgi:hypothetical protein
MEQSIRKGFTTSAKQCTYIGHKNLVLQRAVDAERLEELDGEPVRVAKVLGARRRRRPIAVATVIAFRSPVPPIAAAPRTSPVCRNNLGINFYRGGTWKIVIARTIG